MEGKHLSIEIKISTMAARERGLLEEPFARELAAGAIHFFRDGELYIDLKYDTGRCDFGRSARAPALPRRSQAPCRRPSPGR